MSIGRLEKWDEGHLKAMTQLLGREALLQAIFVIAYIWAQKIFRGALILVHWDRDMQAVMQLILAHLPCYHGSIVCRQPIDSVASLEMV